MDARFKWPYCFNDIKPPLSLHCTVQNELSYNLCNTLEHVEAMKIPSAEEETTTRLCLSIDVQPHNIVISDSAGQITLIDSGTMSMVRQWKGHTYEAWVATFDTQNKETMLSGEGNNDIEIPHAFTLTYFAALN